MKGPLPKLTRPPIVEAVIDFDCDLPEGWRLQDVAPAAHGIYAQQYPKARTRFRQRQTLSFSSTSAPEITEDHDLVAYMFLSEDEGKIVQVRSDGLSFNKMAPYGGFDDYVPEIQWAWDQFLRLAKPLLVRNVHLRYINRILLPQGDSRQSLEGYLELGPRLPDEYEFELGGFLAQYAALERGTDNRVTVSLATQAPEGNTLPVVLDIEAAHPGEIEPNDWDTLLNTLRSLRAAKNRAFAGALKKEALELFS